MQRVVEFKWVCDEDVRDVSLTGSFWSWSSGGVELRLKRVSPGVFTGLRSLPIGRHYYKFIQDGVWHYDPKMPIADDGTGNLNNVIEVHPSTPPSGPFLGSHPGEGDLMGSPSYSHASSDTKMPTATDVLAASRSRADTQSSSYIGVGVLKEYEEEFRLDVPHRPHGGMVRSTSMSGLESHVLGPLPPSWRRMVFGSSSRVGSSATSTASSSTTDLQSNKSGAGERATSALNPSRSLTVTSTSKSSSSSGGGGETLGEGGESGGGGGGVHGFHSASSPSLRGEGGEGGGEGDSGSNSSRNTSSSSGGGSGGGDGSGGGGGSASATILNTPLLPLKRDHTLGRTVGVPTPLQPPNLRDHHASLLGVAHHPLPSPAASTVSSSALSATAASTPTSLYSSSSSAGASAAAAAAAAAAGSLGGGSPHPPLSHLQAYLSVEGKLVVAMVGLPARGKTFIARHLKRHLGWMGYRTEIFNVGNYRRKILGAGQSHDFFDPKNAQGEEQRHAVATLAFNEMTDTLVKDALDVAIFDATNTTVERRQWLASSLATRLPSCRLVFVEPICNDEGVIRSNVVETKLKSPDYKKMDESAAVADFLARIQHYLSVYEPLGEDPSEHNVPYIKLVDLGKTMVCNRIQGYLNSRVMFFLFNLHVTSRPIWLTRHGESEFNVQKRIGGDSGLSLRGLAYAQRMAVFFNNRYPPPTPEGGGAGGDKDRDLVVWTSTLRRTQLTAMHLGRKIVAWKALDEIDAGVCDGMTYEAIAERWPEEYAQRAKSKFTYRYPRGESYSDIVLRLEPLMVELVRQRSPVLIISHQATLRVLYAYLTDMVPASCPDVLLPLHSVIQLTPKAYSAEEVRHELLPGDGK